MISCGFDGYVVSTLTAGLAPISSLMELLTQVRCFSSKVIGDVAPLHGRPLFRSPHGKLRCLEIRSSRPKLEAVSPPTTGLSLFKCLMVLLKLVGPTALVSKPSTNHLNVATELHLRATELEATVQGGDVICIL